MSVLHCIQGLYELSWGSLISERGVCAGLEINQHLLIFTGSLSVQQHQATRSQDKCQTISTVMYNV